MNVLFLNTLYLPTIQELNRLDNIQREISGWRADLAREWQLRKFSTGEKYLSKLRFHNGIRDRWLIYPGFKCENFSNLLEFDPKIS